MNRSLSLVILSLSFFTITGIAEATPVNIESVIPVYNPLDTLMKSQILYNGRIWQNLYYMVKGDQFLFSKMFLPGSLTMKGKTFKDVSLMYDIFKDEILTPIYPGGILQLNKEMVDSFSVTFQNKKYQFTKIQVDSLKGSKGYFNVIYVGKTALYVRYIKKIEKLGDEEMYDKFYQVTRIYFEKDYILYLINGKNDLIKVLIDEKELIKNFIRKNKITISKEEPESFIAVIRYYDTIRK
ncbi:MAG: hypothetical protein EPN88_08900 [Bacteroidetes bacterium]|nr:MAG: hypothetical protein EPN88_08900 [Bacteroidota bacterium]